MNTKDKFSFLLPKFHNPKYKLIKQHVQDRLGVDGIGNGDAVAVEELYSGLDVVNIFRRATVEVAQLRRVVYTSVRRNSGQAQGGAQADTMRGHLIDAVFHRAKASFRCVSGSIHLVRQLLNQRL
jgi:hypothetical protein